MSVAPPPTRRRARAPRVVGRDRQFLPAALEILETPPAPLAVVTMLTICAIFAAAFVWSFFGRLDVNAVAPGKLEPTGRVKVIEALDPGKIATIAVEDGEQVKAGDLLLAFDPAEAEADERGARDALQAGLGEIARRRAAVEAARQAQREAAANGAPLTALDALAANPQGKIAWDEPLPQAVEVREEAVLSADISQLADAQRALDRQIAQKQATLERLRMSIAFQTTLIDTLTQRVATRQQAIDLKVGTKINLYDAKEELEKSQSSLASDQGQLIETDAAIGELQSEKTKALSQFIADNANKAADASRQGGRSASGAGQGERTPVAHQTLCAESTASSSNCRRRRLARWSAPASNWPPSCRPMARCKSRRWSPIWTSASSRSARRSRSSSTPSPSPASARLHGKVVAIAREAVDEQQAKRALANATAPGNAGDSPAAPGQPASFVFPVIVAIDGNAMRVDGAVIALTPGMTATVDIKTESRRVIDYLFSPLAKTVSEAMTER